MKPTSQFLIAVRILNQPATLSARFTIFLESGRVHLYCLNERIVFVELGDLFPASWLAKMSMGELAAQVRMAATSQDKIQAFRAVTEKDELRKMFTDVVKKHLRDFFNSDLRKCEMKADQFPATPTLLNITEMMADCAESFMKSFAVDDLIPSNEVSFQVSSDYLEKSTRMKITLQQGYLLSRLERAQTISEILSTVPGEELATKRNLVLLWAYGILDSAFLNRYVPKLEAGPSKQPAANVPISPKAPEALHEQLEMIDQTYLSLSRRDYYTLLGVSTRADLQEVKTAYYRLARKFHPDRFYGLDDPVMKEKVDIIFSTINVAYETLKNNKTRQQYDSATLDEKRISHSSILSDAPVPGAENTVKVAEEYYQRAQKSYNSRNFYEAVQFLRSATQIAPDVGKYWRHLGVALSKNEQWRKEAEDSFVRAIELEPLNHENHLYLAFLYKNSGLKLRAKRCFQKVLELDPKNDVAPAQLEEIENEDVGGSGKKGILGGVFKKK